MNWRRWNKDRTSAVVLLVLGAAIVAQGVTYRLGNMTHMGAGFVPVVLGVLLAAVGIAIGLTAEVGDFGTAESNPTEWRGWLCVLGGVVAFVVLGRFGLVIATFTSVFIAAIGDRKNSLVTSAVLAAVMTIAGSLIFNVALGIQFPLFDFSIRSAG